MTVERREDDDREPTLHERCMEEYGFHGWDWYELYEAFGYDEDVPEEWRIWILRKEIQELLKPALTGETTHEEQGKINQFRNYVRALRDQSYEWNYTGPFWNGLVQIEPDGVFLKYLSVYLEQAWS